MPKSTQHTRCASSTPSRASVSVDVEHQLWSRVNVSCVSEELCSHPGFDRQDYCLSNAKIKRSHKLCEAEAYHGDSINTDCNRPVRLGEKQVFA
jgi:hypothetical protein